MEEIKSGNTTLFPFKYEGEFYYVRLEQRGKRLDCSGVFKFALGGLDGLSPEFRYQTHRKSLTQKIIKAAKKAFEENQ